MLKLTVSLDLKVHTRSSILLENIAIYFLSFSQMYHF